MAMKRDGRSGGTSKGVTRRDALRGAALGATALAGVSAGGCETDTVVSRTPRPLGADYKTVNNRINQSVCRWCYNDHFKFPELIGHAKAMGLKSVELLKGKDLETVKEAGLVCAITSTHGFTNGMNRKENHAMCIKAIKEGIDQNAALGFPNVITFSGMRKGMPDDVGLDNTEAGLKQVIGYAEQKKVNICIEMLNSRVSDHPMKGHPDYMADSIEWCVELCKRIDSPRMKILFDIYHVQIMQGDVITRIRQYSKYIGHYHTAGNPGRAELDDTQEINYSAIMKEIVKTGYTGYVGQEFIPTREPLAGLREAVAECDV